MTENARVGLVGRQGRSNKYESEDGDEEGGGHEGYGRVCLQGEKERGIGRERRKGGAGRGKEG